MDRQQLEYIKENQESLALEVLTFVQRWASARYGLSATSSILGTSLEDIAVNVLEDYLYERRNLKGDVPLLTQLKNAAKSELLNLFKRKEAKAVPLVNEAEEHAPKSYASATPGPDEDVGSADDCAMILKTLWNHPKVMENDELAAYLMAIEEGAWDETEIAQMSGLTKARVYEVRRHFRKLLPETRRKLQ